MMIPRFFSVWQALGKLTSEPLFSTVAWLDPFQPWPFIVFSTLVCGSCAPSVTRKTKGCVLVDELPLPTLVMVVFIELSAASTCVPPEPRFPFVLVSSSVARFAAAVLIGLLVVMLLVRGK